MVFPRSSTDLNPPNLEAYWLGLNGMQSRIKQTGSPLTDAFHGIRSNDDLDPERSDSVVKAFSASVWAYRCAKVRAQTLAAVPLKFQTDDGEIIDDPDHPLRQLFGPGNSKLLYQTELDALIWGRVFWEMSRTKPSVMRLNPSTMEIEFKGTDPPGSPSKFIQRIKGRVVAEWEPDEIVYFFDYDPDHDWSGIGPMALVLRDAGIDMNTVRFIQAYFANDATPGGLLTTEQQLQDAEVQFITRWWRKLFRGVSKKHSVGVTGFGVKFQPVTSELNKLALETVRAETRRDIHGGMGVRESVTGSDHAANFATAKEDRRSLYTETVLPELDMFLDVINRDLVPIYADGVTVKINRDEIEVLQEDRTEVTERAAKSFTSGVSSLNESRAMQGQEPYEQDWHLFNDILVPAELFDDREALLQFVMAQKPAPQVNLPGGGAASGAQPDSIFGGGNPPPAPGGTPPAEPAPPPEGDQMSGQGSKTKPPPVVLGVHTDNEAQRQAAMIDARRWRKKARAYSPEVEFKSTLIPAGIASIIRYDLTGGVSITDTFKGAFEAIRQIGDEQEEISFLSLPGDTVDLPDPDVSDDDVEAALADWRARHNNTELEAILEAEHLDIKAPFGWDPNLLRYRDAATGKIVSREAFLKWMDGELLVYQDELERILEEASKGALTVEEWEAAMRATLKRGHVQLTMLGAGGVRSMDLSLRGNVGGRLRSQYRFLSNFANALRGGPFTPGGLKRLMVRARMYGAAMRRSFFEGQFRGAKDGRMTQKRRVLNPEAEHCETCVTQSERGWVPIDSPDVTIPASGDTLCLTADKCTMEFRRSARSKKGYPEYNPEQERDERGRWTSGGGAATAEATSGGFGEIKAEDYLRLREATTRPEMLTPYKLEDLQHKLDEGDHIYGKDNDGDGKADVLYILTADGDLQGLVNVGNIRGAGKEAVIDAISRGAKTLDCYAPMLPAYYGRFGFEETERLTFDPQYAPSTWNADKLDHPDVVFMEYPEGLSRDKEEVRQRYEDAARNTKRFRVEHQAAPAGGAERTRAGMGPRSTGESHRRRGRGQAAPVSGTVRGSDRTGTEPPVISGDKYRPDQLRHPTGTPQGGQFASEGADTPSGQPLHEVQAKLTQQIDNLTREYSGIYRQYFRTDNEEEAASLKTRLDTIDAMRDHLIELKEQNLDTVFDSAVDGVCADMPDRCDELRSTIARWQSGEFDVSGKATKQDGEADHPEADFLEQAYAEAVLSYLITDSPEQEAALKQRFEDLDALRNALLDNGGEPVAALAVIEAQDPERAKRLVAMANDYAGQQSDAQGGGENPPENPQGKSATKPYASDSDVPDHVPAGDRAQWREIWNSVYNKCIEDGGDKDKCESRAFAAANDIL